MRFMQATILLPPESPKIDAAAAGLVNRLDACARKSGFPMGELDPCA